jgi:sterol desaturase/sphingolipid hydroxylase (fatty acid hydroxylase superfamily)
VARPSIAAQQPEWLQVVEVLVGGDLIGYWLHRAFHTNRRLWPFHAVHHSTPMLDWVAAAREHPVDKLVHQVLTVIPFFLLGFQPAILAAYAPFLTIYPILLHANVRWGFGPLRWAIASPAWHRWHHASEAQALDKNFSGLFPFIDVLFGTAYFPHRAPKRFGLADGLEPHGLWAQLLYPFRQTAAV